MKWFSLITVLALAFFVNACEMHPASDAPGEGATEFGKHKKEGETEVKPAAEAPAPAKSETATPAPEAKPGEAPKFFPENK